MSKGFLYDTGDELITREDVNEVPDGSTASAGDVLSLDSNKKPKWSAPSGGGGPLVVKATGICTKDTSDPDETVFTISADKTVEEIAEAIDPDNFKGLIILFPMTFSDESPYYSYDKGIDLAVSEISVLFSETLNNFTCFATKKTNSASDCTFDLNEDGDGYIFEIIRQNEH